MTFNADQSISLALLQADRQLYKTLSTMKNDFSEQSLKHLFSNPTMSDLYMNAYKQAELSQGELKNAHRQDQDTTDRPILRWFK